MKKIFLAVFKKNYFLWLEVQGREFRIFLVLLVAFFSFLSLGNCSQ